MKPAQKHSKESSVESLNLKNPVCMPVITPTGPGLFKVELGKPMFWLNTKEFAKQFSVVSDTVLLWIAEGVIPERFVERAGRIRWRISSEAVEFLKDSFRKDFDSEKAVPNQQQKETVKADLKRR